ncbi:MAG: hypothetical protein ACK464_09285, partial [Bacteroidota bacterium]
EGLAFERAQQLNTIEAYEQFLKSQLPPPLQRNDLTFRAQFLLRSLTVKPIPIAYNKTKEPYKEGFYFADSATLQPWMELVSKWPTPMPSTTTTTILWKVGLPSSQDVPWLCAPTPSD